MVVEPFNVVSAKLSRIFRPYARPAVAAFGLVTTVVLMCLNGRRIWHRISHLLFGSATEAEAHREPDNAAQQALHGEQDSTEQQALLGERDSEQRALGLSGQDDSAKGEEGPEPRLTGTSEIAEGTQADTRDERLRQFGYEFNSDGKLVNIHTGAGFVFEGQKHYEDLGEVMNEYVYHLLETQGGLEKKMLPAEASQCQGFFFASPDVMTNDKGMLVLIHGTGVVRAGQWARRLIINHSLKSGSQLPYIAEAKSKGWSVVVMNTNQRNDYSTEHGFLQGYEPEDHGSAVWKAVIERSPAKYIGIVAHSYGGHVTSCLLRQYTSDFKKRVVAIALTDSFCSVRPADQKYFKEVARNWVTSSEQLGKSVGYAYDCDRVSAGTTVHEETSWKSMEAVFSFIEEKFLPRSTMGLDNSERNSGRLTIPQQLNGTAGRPDANVLPTDKETVVLDSDQSYPQMQMHVTPASGDVKPSFVAPPLHAGEHEQCGFASRQETGQQHPTENRSVVFDNTQQHPLDIPSDSSFSGAGLSSSHGHDHSQITGPNPSIDYNGDTREYTEDIKVDVCHHEKTAAHTYSKEDDCALPATSQPTALPAVCNMVGESAQAASASSEASVNTVSVDEVERNGREELHSDHHAEISGCTNAEGFLTENETETGQQELRHINHQAETSDCVNDCEPRTAENAEMTEAPAPAGGGLDEAAASYPQPAKIAESADCSQAVVQGIPQTSALAHAESTSDASGDHL